jgi:hypothetical protein
MHQLVVEVWYEHPVAGWIVLPGVGGVVDLRHLRPVDKCQRGEHSLEFSIKGDGGVWYSTAIADDLNGSGDGKMGVKAAPRERGASVRGVLERSVRETRMKKGVSIGSLHQ